VRRSSVSVLCIALATLLVSACNSPSVPPLATTTSLAAVSGFYIGSGNGANMLAMGTWMNNTKVQWAGDYADWEGPTQWGVGQWENIEQPHVLWSMAFLPQIAADKGSNPSGWLAEVKADMNLAASGAYDSHWLDVGRRMAATSRQGKDAIRIGWELGGNWYPWGSTVFAGAGALQKQAWEHYATALRTSGWKVKTVWDSEDNTTLPDPSLIDVINTGGYDGGADAWAGCGAGGHNADGTWLHPAEVWACAEQGMGPRLQKSVDLAQSLGKPLAISEWGLSNGNDDTYFVQAMHDFVVTHDVVYSIYFDNDNNSDWSEMHNFDHFPNGKPLFRQIFSQP
jgi:hypothetical protein